jgi:hypothetical protein
MPMSASGEHGACDLWDLGAGKHRALAGSTTSAGSNRPDDALEGRATVDIEALRQLVRQRST